MRQLQCTWVPGTTDRVRFRGPLGLVEMTLDRAERVLGRGSLRELYLKGRVILHVSDDVMRRLAV